MSTIYGIINGKLRIQKQPEGKDIWEGGFDGISVVQIAPFGDRCLVLLDPGAKQTTFENLLMVSSDGVVVWKAQLPQTHDSFTKVMVQENAIEATTWNGIRVKLESVTGKILENRFVK